MLETNSFMWKTPNLGLNSAISDTSEVQLLVNNRLRTPRRWDALATLGTVPSRPAPNAGAHGPSAIRRPSFRVAWCGGCWSIEENQDEAKESGLRWCASQEGRAKPLATQEEGGEACGACGCDIFLGRSGGRGDARGGCGCCRRAGRSDTIVVIR